MNVNLWNPFDEEKQSLTIPEHVRRHPAFYKPTIEDHPFYQTKQCLLHDGSEPLAEGIKQALILSKVCCFFLGGATVFFAV